ncbi:MAG: hypothetical protein AB7G05_13950, partial [Hyphomonadaceae bacterium]
MPAQTELARLARPIPHVPNAALSADAGMYAPHIARVWPRPHAPYFAAEPARRRLACLAAQGAPGETRALADALETWSLKRIASAYLPGAPAGLVEALRKIEGDAWTSDDYRRLMALLEERGGAKVIRHAPALTRDFVYALTLLPPPMRRSRILALAPSYFTAGLVARAAKRACGKDARAMTRLADRLERARTPAQLFRMLVDEIGLEQLAPPPIPGADWLAPIASALAIERAALKFENCLKGRIPLMLRGKAAYYEVLGDEP